MGKTSHTDSVTIYAQLRENYNDTHSDFLSQSKLGEALGVTKSMVSKIENGKVLPSNEIIDAYSKFFEVAVVKGSPACAGLPQDKKHRRCVTIEW